MALCSHASYCYVNALAKSSGEAPRQRIERQDERRARAYVFETIARCDGSK